MNPADNGNGTFTNPVIFADYPDADIIRVEEDFYLVSTSFTDAPGLPICHSRDLVSIRGITRAFGVYYKTILRWVGEKNPQSASAEGHDLARPKR